MNGTSWYQLLGDLNQVPLLTSPLVGVISILVSSLCGAIVGLERERREKPAGFRTLILISVGSSIFTIASLLITGDSGERGRIAAQVVSGIGFLGAGAIIHERRSVIGMTTAATIWASAAIGVVVGIGYAAAGLVLSIFIFLILTFLRMLEGKMFGPCQRVRVRIAFDPRAGRTRPRLQSILDENHLPGRIYHFTHRPSRTRDDSHEDCLEVEYCTAHRAHRAFLAEIASLSEVQSIEETSKATRIEKIEA